jgi:hypothetical protein
MINGYKEHRLVEDDSYYADEVKFNELFNKEDSGYNWDIIVFGTEDIGRHPLDTLSDREKKIVASVTQWLGTPVGNSFLREAGFVKEKTNEN